MDEELGKSRPRRKTSEKVEAELTEGIRSAITALQVRGRICAVPPGRGRCGPLRQAAAAVRLHGRLRRCGREPTVFAVTAEGTHYLLETKGLEDPNVVHKDRAAQIWCENATMLTGTQWEYLKVPQKDFEALDPAQFVDLQRLQGPLMSLEIGPGAIAEPPGVRYSTPKPALAKVAEAPARYTKRARKPKR